jgi:endoglucanase
VKLGWHFATLSLLIGATGCQSPTAQKPAGRTHDWSRFEQVNSGIIRGDKNRKAIALSFTGHEFAEGGATILDELQKHRAKGSFFLTGAFLANPAFQPLVRRIATEGHYFSAHSDAHLLYCSWDKDRQTLVTQAQFTSDLKRNFQRFQELELAQSPGRYFIPPFEHYNTQIVAWAEQMEVTLINYTPGTRSHADYTGEADRNFTSAQVIFDSIVKREQTDPHGLNGFILLLHLGSGPGRADKFPARFGELLDHLAAQGYEFVRVDELLAPTANP